MNSILPVPALLFTFKQRNWIVQFMGGHSLPVSFSCFQNISSFLRGNYLTPSGCTSKQTVCFLVSSSHSLWQGCSGLVICSLSAHSEGQPEWWYMCHQPQEALLARWCCHVDDICLFIWWHLFTQHESGKKIPFPAEWEIRESSRVLVPASRWCSCSEFMVYLVKAFNNIVGVCITTQITLCSRYTV